MTPYADFTYFGVLLYVVVRGASRANSLHLVDATAE